MTLILLMHLIFFTISFVLLKFTKWKDFFISNNFILGIAGLVLFVGFAGQLFISWYSGYLPEEIAFYQRFYGNSFFIVTLIYMVAFVLGLFNFFKKYRKLINFQFLIMGLIIIVLIVRRETIVDLLETQSIVEPGWHTTIVGIGNFYWIYPVLLITMNVAIIKFRLLPEFKRANAHADRQEK